MLVAYVLCAIVAAVLLYLAWVYYVLFCKEKQKDEKLPTESFYTRNQEFSFAYPQRESSILPTAGKVAAVAGLLVVPRRQGGRKDEEQKHEVSEGRRFSQDHPNVIAEGINVLDLMNSEKDANIDVHSATSYKGDSDTYSGTKLVDEGKSDDNASTDRGVSARVSSTENLGSYEFKNVDNDELTSKHVTFETSTNEGYRFSQGFGSSDDYGYGNGGNDPSYGAYENTGGGDEY